MLLMSAALHLGGIRMYHSYLSHVRWLGWWNAEGTLWHALWDAGDAQRSVSSSVAALGLRSRARRGEKGTRGSVVSSRKFIVHARARRRTGGGQTDEVGWEAAVSRWAAREGDGGRVAKAYDGMDRERRARGAQGEARAK